MNELLRILIFICIAIVMIWTFFVQKFPEYECIEYRPSATSVNPDVLIPTDRRVIFYEGGGVYNFNTLKSDEYHSKVLHKKVEGDKYISYLRSNGIYSYKLNKDDLTYYYRLGSRSGQCTKVGFLKKYSYDSFEMLETTEYAY